MYSISIQLACLAAAFISSVGASRAVQANIVLTNDDGWAVANIRAQNTALKAAGFNVVLSAPAIDQSGTGSSDATPTTVDSSGCEFKTCAAGAPAEGSNSSDTHLNYCNSYPATSARYGIKMLAPKYFNGSPPDFVVSGPNVGNNLGSTVLISGTVGAATEAAKEGIPSVAFSGDSGSWVSYTTLSSSSSSTTAANIYGALGTSLTQALLATPFSASAPILPANISLNVNFPATKGSCMTASAFKFVLTRINAATSSTPADVKTCSTTRLPTETTVVGTKGCLASVSVMNATTKGDVDAATQQFVLNKLSGIFTCS